MIVFKKAAALNSRDELAVVDFKQYWPSYMAPAGFVASPIFVGNKKVGVAIFQFPIDNLNAIMSERTGLGETGDARVFKQKDTYYIHYIRDDGIEYIGIGVLSSNYLAITYIYPGFSDVGTTHYEIKNGNLYGYWTCLECDGQIISENLYKK